MNWTEVPSGTAAPPFVTLARTTTSEPTVGDRDVDTIPIETVQVPPFRRRPGPAAAGSSEPSASRRRNR